MRKHTRREFLGYAAAVVLVLGGCQATYKTRTGDSSKITSVEETVVGVYDSRVIALAYWRENVDGKERLHNHEALGMKAIDLGVLMHQQVFSYHEPVQALEYIADKLPEVMEQAGVDVIVSKWDKEELAKYNVIGSGWDDEDFINSNPNKVVNITETLSQLYNPQFQVGNGFEKSKPESFDTDWKNVRE